VFRTYSRIRDRVVRFTSLHLQLPPIIPSFLPLYSGSVSPYRSPPTKRQILPSPEQKSTWRRWQHMPLVDRTVISLLYPWTLEHRDGIRYAQVCTYFVSTIAYLIHDRIPIDRMEFACQHMDHHTFANLTSFPDGSIYSWGRYVDAFIPSGIGAPN
jgi:hypothetical protein